MHWDHLLSMCPFITPSHCARAGNTRQLRHTGISVQCLIRPDRSWKADTRKTHRQGNHAGTVHCCAREYGQVRGCGRNRGDKILKRKIANAVFTATGERSRTLTMTKQEWFRVKHCEVKTPPFRGIQKSSAWGNSYTPSLFFSERNFEFTVK